MNLKLYSYKLFYLFFHSFLIYYLLEAMLYELAKYEIKQIEDVLNTIKTQAYKFSIKHHIKNEIKLLE